MTGKRSVKVWATADAKAFAKTDVQWQRLGMTDKELDDVSETSADMRNLTGPARIAYLDEYKRAYRAREGEATK